MEKLLKLLSLGESWESFLWHLFWAQINNIVNIYFSFTVYCPLCQGLYIISCISHSKPVNSGVSSLFIFQMRKQIQVRKQIFSVYWRTLFYCTWLYRGSQMCCFYKFKARPSTRKKDYSSLYCGGLEWNLQHLRGMPANALLGNSLI